MEEEKLVKVMLEQLQTVELIVGWRGGGTDAYGGSNSKGSTWSILWESLLVSACLRERKGNLLSWPDEHASWSQSCCASYTAPFKFLTTSAPACLAYKTPKPPTANSIHELALVYKKVPAAIVAHMPYRGNKGGRRWEVVMGDWGGRKRKK